jgi:death on curing protein
VEHLTVEDLVLIAETIGTAVVRDVGLLDAAAHRPRATAFGEDAYPTLHEKAAALLDAVVRNHALVDGNKRLGWASAVVFYDVNGFDLVAPSVAEAVDLVVAVAAGHLELEKLSERLATWAVSRDVPGGPSPGAAPARG